MEVRLVLAPTELNEYIKEYTNRSLSACMQCGLCSAVCPMAKFMDIHPAALIRLLQVGDVDIARLKAIWICVSCMACVDRCPRDVAPGMVIETLRLIALRRGIEPRSYSEMPIDATTPILSLVSYSRKLTG